jgi:histidine triad (HIT) family protein
MDDCIFCKIISGAIPSEQVYSDGQMLVFRDIRPQAAVHLLAVPRRHIESAARIDAATAGHIFEVIAERHAAWGLANGFRVVTNSGPDARQTVGHVHFHILGGQELSLKMS